MVDRRPLLVVAGVDKAGTTTLAAALRQHPELEKWEWVDGELRPHRDGRRGSPAVLVRDNRFFADPNAPAALSEGGREVHAVVSLRDPIGRVESLYRHRRAMGRLPVALGIDEFVRLQLDGQAPAANDYLVVAEGRYADSVAPWQKQLGDRFRVVFFREWIGDVLAEVKDLVEWAGLDPERLEVLESEQANPSGDARYPRLSRGAHLAGRKVETFARRLGQRERVRRSVTSATQALYVRTVRVDGPASRLGATMRGVLEEYYRESDERLADLLGRPLPWADSPS